MALEHYNWHQDPFVISFLSDGGNRGRKIHLFLDILPTFAASFAAGRWIVEESAVRLYIVATVLAWFLTLLSYGYVVHLTEDWPVIVLSRDQHWWTAWFVQLVIVAPGVLFGFKSIEKHNDQDR